MLCLPRLYPHSQLRRLSGALSKVVIENQLRPLHWTFQNMWHICNTYLTYMPDCSLAMNGSPIWGIKGWKALSGTLFFRIFKITGKKFPSLSRHFSSLLRGYTIATIFSPVPGPHMSPGPLSYSDSKCSKQWKLDVHVKSSNPACAKSSQIKFEGKKL